MFRVLIGSIGAGCIASWVLMVLMAIIRVNWLHNMPPLGYEGALFITGGIGLTVLVGYGMLFVWTWLMGLGE